MITRHDVSAVPPQGGYIAKQLRGACGSPLTSTPVDRELEARLPKGSRELVRVVRESGRASTGDLVEATGRSRPVVLRQLRALQEAGIVVWSGHSKQDPRAYWSLRIE